MTYDKFKAFKCEAKWYMKSVKKLNEMWNDIRKCTEIKCGVKLYMKGVKKNLMWCQITHEMCK